MVNAGADEEQTLVISAFLSEYNKWEKYKAFLQKEFERLLEVYKQARTSANEEPSWKLFLYNKVLKKLTPAQAKIEGVMITVSNLTVKIIKHDATEPDSARYELAALGNNIFKPR